MRSSPLDVIMNFCISSAKIMQIERRTSSWLECYAEMQLILSNDNANRTQNIKFLRAKNGENGTWVELL